MATMTVHEARDVPVDVSFSFKRAPVQPPPKSSPLMREHDPLEPPN